MGTRMKYTSHVGMNFRNGYLFCFQLLGDDGKAHASVSFTDGCVTQVLFTPALALRVSAILRLAKYHLSRTGEN